MLLQPVDIALFIAEFQRVGRDLRLFERFEYAVIEEEPQPVPGWNAHVMAGRGHDPLVLLQIRMEDHFAGFGILDPEIFRHFTAAKHRIDLWPDVIRDPVHDRSCSSLRSFADLGLLLGRGKP